MLSLKTTREDHIIAWLTALAVCIHVLEAALPSPLPGIKPGLANVVTVMALVTYGWRIAVWVSVLRVLTSSLILGTFLSPTFILSFSGAVATMIAIGICHRLLGSNLSALGLSVIGAFAHMTTQFWVAYWLFIPHPGLFHLLPVFMTAALVFGVISGLIASHALRHQTGSVSS